MTFFRSNRKGKLSGIILGGAALVLLFLTLALFPAFAQDEDPPPERRVVVKVADEGYLWWLKNWSDGEVVCELLIAHPGLPTWEEVSRVCGEPIFEQWKETPACFEAVDDEDTSDCEGVFLLYAGYLKGERAVVEELPKPSVSLSLQGCERVNLSYLCAANPLLVFQALEPLPDERISSITIELDDETYECDGALCELPLRPYQGLELEMSFWAESTYGDSTPAYGALARPVLLSRQDSATPEMWQIEVLSTQWVGPSPAACAFAWGSLPPVGPSQIWLRTPVDAVGLATDEPLELLAGRLLSWGLVDASSCPYDGLMLDGTASVCGVESTQAAVYEWQDRFDSRIFSVAKSHGLPAVLVKRIFAKESQFWPGGFPNLVEYGLGGLHIEGTDTLLLWNVSFYQQLCPLVLSEETCSKRYHELDYEAQEMLRGALAIQANVTCATCPTGIDLEKADGTVDLFADLLLANCAQMGEVVRQTFNTAPGNAASYPDLWRLTLVNYNAGSGCLYEALEDINRQRKILVWPNVREALLELEACRGAIKYVEDITGY
ncbi:MAG: hypothetical protein E4G99_10750 [Anaerolineales bacterium]|nr:MAG: hypothetical protein E4G99_10750 [Anaerolineales bacterium]